MEPAQPPFVGIVSGAPDESGEYRPPILLTPHLSRSIQLVVRVGSSELFIFHPDLTATWEDVDGSEWPIVFMFDSGVSSIVFPGRHFCCGPLMNWVSCVGR